MTALSSPRMSSRSRFPSGPQRQHRASRACSEKSSAAKPLTTLWQQYAPLIATMSISFFNAVHLHRSRARSLHITDAAPRQPGPSATRCPGMEFALGTLNSFAHWEEPATLLAPVGSGGEALIRHWAELVRRSQSQATRWRVLLDGVPILDVHGAQLVRLAYPYSFVPVPTENFVYCDGMDQRFANTLLAARDRRPCKAVLRSTHFWACRTS